MQLPWSAIVTGSYFGRYGRPIERYSELRSVVVRDMLVRVSTQAFMALDRIGLHVLPKHYYSAVPDYSWLRKSRAAWAGRTCLVGVHWDLQEQLEWVANVCRHYYHEVEGLSFYRDLIASTERIGAGYGEIESQILHCFMRYHRPGRVVEIGSGTSTAIMLRASDLNASEGFERAHITSIDPFPKRGFERLRGITHIRQACQIVDLSIFEQLESGDLLFVDSTHAVKAGSDVLRVYLEIIPRLKPGVFIQIHDVTLPYLYNRDVLWSYFDWQETSLVLALLVNNSRLSVLCCESALHYDRPGELAVIVRDYEPQTNCDGLRVSNAGKHFPSSLWLRTL